MDTGWKADGNLRQVHQQPGVAAAGTTAEVRRPLSPEAQKELDQLTAAYNETIEHDAQHLCRVDNADVVSAKYVHAAAAPHALRPRPRYKHWSSIGGLLLGLALTLVFDPARWTAMTGAIGMVATLSAAIGAALIGMAWVEDAKVARSASRNKAR